MDKSVASTAPYFDAGEVGRELVRYLEQRRGAAQEARPAVLERLKELLRAARAEAARQLDADGKGRRCTQGLAAFQDGLIRLVYDYTVGHVYRATNPSAAERMAIVATGGYGRGLIAPFSDIDLLFVLPYKQTPWGESVRRPSAAAARPPRRPRCATAARRSGRPARRGRCSAPRRLQRAQP